MSAVMGTPYSPPSPPATSSSATMSPTMSPVYPDRPIRPLPKRSLKDRLSSEAADSIAYPPAPPSTNAAFHIPYPETVAQRNGTMIKGAFREIDRAMNQVQHQAVEDDTGAYRFRGNELTSEDEEEASMMIRRYQDFQQQQQRLAKGTTNGYSYDPENSHSIASSNDSADGYDSFENTNNKKKRKIPTSGNAAASMSGSLSQDLANMGLSNGEDSVDRADNGISHYYTVGSGVSSNGTGISGAGRGRYGRNGRRDVSGRLPLHSSINGSNAWPNGKVPSGGKGIPSKAEPMDGDKGIISQAIADAAALQNVTTQGQENVSLLEQQSQKKSPAVNSHFTFTYESESPSKPVWPKNNSMMPQQQDHQVHPPSNSQALPTGHQQRKDFSTQGTQTSPPGPSDPLGAHPADLPRKPRRSASRRYAIAARERRAQQEYNNYHHPPKEEDFWICEFCEYESIFGRPPEALIRQYEMKDEKERKRQAEKRRLLEKAKMKGRKGKKGKGKGLNNPPPPPQPAYDPAIPGSYPAYGHPSEDAYYGDGYDEPGTPAPSPEPLSRIPQPINHTPGQSTRTAHGHKQQSQQQHPTN